MMQLGVEFNLIYWHNWNWSKPKTKNRTDFFLFRLVISCYSNVFLCYISLLPLHLNIIFNGQTQHDNSTLSLKSELLSSNNYLPWVFHPPQFTHWYQSRSFCSYFALSDSLRVPFQSRVLFNPITTPSPNPLLGSLLIHAVNELSIPPMRVDYAK